MPNFHKKENKVFLLLTKTLLSCSKGSNPFPCRYCQVWATRGYNVGCFLCCFCYMKITIFVELRQCYVSVITCSPTVNDVYDQTSSGFNDALCWLTCCSCCLIGPETLRCACIICCWICKRWYAWKKGTKSTIHFKRYTLIEGKIWSFFVNVSHFGPHFINRSILNSSWIVSQYQRLH